MLSPPQPNSHPVSVRETDRPILVTSNLDEASTTMHEELLERQSFSQPEAVEEGELFSTKELLHLHTHDELIRSDHLDLRYNPLYYVFLSKHRSESGIPALTSHFTGNFAHDAPAGGRPRELGFNLPSLLRNYLRELWKRREMVPGYQIVLEATHHGPTALRKPVMFVELGSTPREWKDRTAAATVVDSLLSTMKLKGRAEKVGIGMGGTHYPEKFTKILIEGEYALAAIAPKYSLEFLDSVMLQQARERSAERVGWAVLDWKGLGKEKERILKLVSDEGLEVVRV